MHPKTLAAILIVTLATVIMVIIYKKRMGEQILASRRNMMAQCNDRINVARGNALPQIDLMDLQATAGGLAALSGNVIDSAIQNQRIAHLSDIFGDAIYVSGDGSNANQSDMPYLPPTGCGMECLHYAPAPVNEWNDGDGQQRYHM